MVDPVVNKGKVTVSTGYNSTATSIVLATGQGVELPDPVVDGAYNLPWWDSTNYNDPADDPNYEIVRVTGPAGTGDTKTIVRAQEGTVATNKNNADATYKMHLGVTAKTITDLIADVEKAVTVIVGKSGHVDYLTTDYGSDDACIQAAIDGTSIGDILVREGIYTLEAVLVPKSNIDIHGVGFGTVFKVDDSANIHAFQSTSVSNATYSNFKIDGNKANQTTGGKGIRLQDCTNILIENVWFDDIYQHAISNEINTGSNDIRIKNNYFTNIGKTAVVGSAIYISNTDSCQITGNIIDTATGDGIQGGNVTDPPINFHVLDNIVLNCERYGIYFNAADTIKISNNTINTSGTLGLFLSNTDDGIISNNTVIDSQQDGIRIEDCNYCSVLDNTTKNNNIIAGTNYGIRIRRNTGTCTYNTIIGNRCFDTNGTPVQDSGIAEVGTTDYNTIIGNMVTPNLGANIIKAGANTIVLNNMGYNPVGAVGPPSVPATTVNYTNAYGYPCQVQVYGGTVTEIDIDDISTGLTSGIFIIPPGGTINITYSAAPSWRWWGL